MGGGSLYCVSEGGGFGECSPIVCVKGGAGFGGPKSTPLLLFSEIFGFLPVFFEHSGCIVVLSSCRT